MCFCQSTAASPSAPLWHNGGARRCTERAGEAGIVSFYTFLYSTFDTESMRSIIYSRRGSHKCFELIWLSNELQDMSVFCVDFDRMASLDWGLFWCSTRCCQSLNMTAYLWVISLWKTLKSAKYALVGCNPSRVIRRGEEVFYHVSRGSVYVAYLSLVCGYVSVGQWYHIEE